MKDLSKGKIYLIPSSIAEGDARLWLPEGTLEVIRRLTDFVVENERTARRFLRNAGYDKDFAQVHFGLLSEHTRDDEIEDLLAPALNGKDIGLLSEAGLPCVADPGAVLVAAAHRLDLKVMPLSGPSSIMMALMASGLNGQQFMFHGYLPIPKPERALKIKEIESTAIRTGYTQIFIEAPYRNNQLLAALIENCREHTLLCIACNIGATSETIISRPLSWWKRSRQSFNKQPVVFLISPGV